MCIGPLKPAKPAPLPAAPPAPTPAPKATAPQVDTARRTARQQAAAAMGTRSNIRNEGGAQGLLSTGTNFGRATVLGGTDTRRRVVG